MQHHIIKYLADDVVLCCLKKKKITPHVRFASKNTSYNIEDVF